MRTPLQNTALLLFIRDVDEETRVKHLTSLGRSTEREVVKVLNRRVLRVARRTGLPTVVVSGKEQRGADFGERFTHAFSKVFDAGYERVVAIGNDCLSLDERQLLEAAEALQSRDMVLGPAYDGGAYIVGLSRSLFEAGAFEQLPWQRAELFSALTYYAQQRGAAPFLLRPEWDADDARSFQKALRRLSGRHPLRRRLIFILHKATLPVGARKTPPSAGFFLSAFSLRGPPVQSFI